MGDLMLGIDERQSPMKHETKSEISHGTEPTLSGEDVAAMNYHPDDAPHTPKTKVIKARPPKKPSSGTLTAYHRGIYRLKLAPPKTNCSFSPPDRKSNFTSISLFMNTTLLLNITLVGVFAVSCLISFVWCRRAAGDLEARRRFLTIALWVLALVCVAMAFSKPNLGLLGFVGVIAIGERERRRLSRQIIETERNDVA